MAVKIPFPSPTNPRILVLGSQEYGRSVTAYKWTEIPKTLNLSDFDLLILDFVTDFFTDSGTPVTPLGINLPEAENFYRLLFRKQSIVFAIGTPDSTFQIAGGVGVSTQSVQWWLPCTLPIEHRR